jgi:PAS domain S-box-containing protein
MLDSELVAGLFEAAPDGLVVVDEAGTICAFSGTAEKQFGYTREEVLGRSIELLVPDRHQPAHARVRTDFVRSPDSRAMGHGRTLVGRRKDGSEFPVEISLGPVRTPKGSFVVASVRDVSDRIRTDLALMEAEERFRLSFEEAPIGMALVGLDGRFLRVNRAYCAIAGYSADELAKLTFQDITHPEDLDTDVDLARQLAAGTIPRYHFAKRYVRKDGRIVDVMLSASVVRLADGSPRYFISQVEDISERKRAEEALRRSEAQFRELIERMPDGVLIHWNEEVMYANDAIARVMGVASGVDLVGKQLAEFYLADDMPIIRERIAELTTTGRPLKPKEVRIHRSDGTIAPVEAVGFIMEFDGRPGIIALIRDLSGRKEAEEALRESEARYRELYDHASDGIFIIDREGRCTSANPAACRMLGWTQEELERMHIFDVVPREDVPRVQAVREELTTPDRISVEEWSLRRKDGSFLPVEISARIQPNGCWQALVRDISERRRAAEALARSENQLKRAQRITQLGSWEWDLQTNEMIRSDEIYAIYGVERTPDLAEPLAFSRFLPRGEVERVERMYADALRRGGPFRAEHRIIRPDGQERVLLSQGEVVKENGLPVRLNGTTVDITERKQAEQIREDALRRLRTLIDACPVGILLFERTPEWQLQANRYAIDVLGGPVDRTRGAEQFVGLLYTSSGRALTVDELPSTRAMRSERVDQEELWFRRAGRADTPFLVNATPLKDAEGRVTSVVVAFTDISPLKELERLRAEWNTLIAHDLRQPLTTITLHAEMAARLAANAAPQATAQILQIRNHAARLTRMIRDLLDLSRLDAHQLPLVMNPLDIVAIARDCISDFTQEAPERVWKLEVAEGIPLVMGDSDRIQQILENLLTNAMKYGYADSPVELRISQVNDQVAVEVRNRGEGIAESEMPLLFQRFQRAANVKGGSIKGIGLGLYITKALVEAQGGTITVQSTPHETTTFRFTLPVARPKQAS